jgi:NADPH-dependent 2,4-dienoyl-CoA reductase/sulfur reductase-like enzyme
MSALRDVVVVGAGLAGLSAAQQLRELGFDGTLTVVGDEPRPPYDRPPLSKRVLTAAEPPDVALPGADALGAGWSLGAPAVALDPVEGTVTTADGRRHRADGVVIATGARPRPWSGPGAALHGVRPLATLPDALALREVLDRAGRLLVLGGGFVGAEVAAAARSRGSAVTVVEQREVLLGALGTVAGRVVTDLLARAGVDVRTATTLRALEGDRRGAVRRAVLSDGAELVVDAVVVGTGVAADIRWLRDSGLLLDDGVVCDGACRAVRRRGAGAPGVPVVVAGDVARRPDPLLDGRLTAVRHWSNAREQGAAAARTLITGAAAPAYVHVPSFWSDLDTPAGRLRIRSVGHTSDADAVQVLDGDLATGKALLAYGRAGRLVGAVSLDRPRHRAALRDQIAARAAFPGRVPAPAVLVG